jgi:hypothetical protein
MCTVTYIPSGERAYLVSNRDEKHYRADAISPQAYQFPSGEIIFPRDADAGGTWIAMHDNGNAIVFLNGGLEAHTPEPPYRKSRGRILLDLINAESSSREFSSMSFEAIEPFTAVIWENERLYECIWDGQQKHFIEKDKNQPHIWSSVTLYNETIRSKRIQWFNQWLDQHPEPGLPDILHFHQFTGEGDAQNDLLMNRDGYVYTVSITGMQLSRTRGEMVYMDMKNNRRSCIEMNFRQSTAADQR